MQFEEALRFVATVDADQAVGRSIILAEELVSRTAPTGAFHDSLVVISLSTPEIMEAVREGEKIRAIKVLRNTATCGLKEAKDAIEHKLLMGPSHPQA